MGRQGRPPKVSDVRDAKRARRGRGRKRTRQSAGLEPARGHTAVYSTHVQADYGIEVVDGVASQPFNFSQPSAGPPPNTLDFSQVSLLTSSDESESSDDGAAPNGKRVSSSLAALQDRIRRHLDTLVHFRGPPGATISAKAAALAAMARQFLDSPEMKDPRAKKFRNYMVSCYIGDPRHIPSSAVGLDSGYAQPAYLPVKWSEVRRLLRLGWAHAVTRLLRAFRVCVST